MIDCSIVEFYFRLTPSEMKQDGITCQVDKYPPDRIIVTQPTDLSWEIGSDPLVYEINQTDLPNDRWIKFIDHMSSLIEEDTYGTHIFHVEAGPC